MISIFYEHPTGFRFNLSESEHQQIEDAIYKNPVFWIKTSWLITKKVLMLYMKCFVFALFFRFVLTYNVAVTCKLDNNMPLAKIANKHGDCGTGK